MNINTGIVAGISVTAVVAVTSIVDHSARRNRKRTVAQAKPFKPSASVPIASASQEMPFVYGNMFLITNM